MGFQAWLRQVQEKFYYFCKRNERPEDEHNNFSPEDEESLPISGLCACQKQWDKPRLPSTCQLPGKDNRIYVTECVPLYKATINGDWKGMKRILSRNDKTILCSSLTKASETALHVAVGARHAAIVKKLVEQMEPHDLELQDRIGNTAFCIAVAKGSVKIAKILMQRREEFVLMRGADNKTPLCIAVAAGHPEMIRLVYQKFRPHISHLTRAELLDIFLGCIDASLFDLAIDRLRFCRELAWGRDHYKETAFGILARKLSAFDGKSSTRPTRLVEHVGRYWFNTSSMQNEAVELAKLLLEIMSSDEQKPFEAHVFADEILFEAAKLGNDKLLALLIGTYPDLIFRNDEYRRSIFHFAVLHRHASIFGLIHNFDFQKDIIVRRLVNFPDKENNSILCNMLQLAAKLPSVDRLNIVSGAALQMQHELLWFEEVEKLAPTSVRLKRDSKENLTPRELFAKEHEQLRRDGEAWMRSTAGSGMVVATLITTVAFTAALTLPGGNKEPDGAPVNIGKFTFHVFLVSDAVAMCSSIISALMFLSIFTSRYAQEDFLFRLPLKLLFGFATVFLSMMTLMVSFAAMFFLAYEKENLTSVHKSKLTWVPCLVATMSFLPIISFLMLEKKYFRDVFRSTFCSKSLFRPNKPTF